MEKSKRPLLILGTRTLAVKIMDFAQWDDAYEVAGFVENMQPEQCSETLEGLPIIWVDDLGNYAATHQVICGLATTFRGRFTDQADACGIPFATLVHPTAIISPNVELAEGVIIGPGVNIATHTRLGRHVLVNSGAIIGHHTEFGDFASIQPGANVAGCCRIGRQAYIGIGATVIDHITIGSNSVIGAGAVVTKDVANNVMAVGVPAKVVKTDIAGK